MRIPIVVIALGLSVAVQAQLGNTPGSGFTTIIGSAMRYVMAYEQKFTLLAADETYVQELQRPPNPGDNLSRTNPGGGMRAGGAMSRLVIKSDFLLVQLGGDGEGWMPFRDAYEVKGAKVRNRDERLLKLFQGDDQERFEKAAKFNEVTASHNLGNVARTINIPTLAMMFLHPRVNERFEFTDEGEETIAGRVLRRAAYREVVRPTLIKTTRGRDLALTGHLWIDPFTGMDDSYDGDGSSGREAMFGVLAASPFAEVGSGGATTDDPYAELGLSRNATCPCGSGKKYKHCHGAIA